MLNVQYIDTRFLFIVLLLGTFILVAVVKARRSLIKFHKGIPVLPGYPILGTAVLLVPIFGFDSHREVLKLVENYGSICQCLLLGKHCLLINHPKVIKVALEKVKGKGDFHQRIFSAVNIFSCDTNNEWKSRRHSFRHAFTSMNLKHFRDNLKSVSNNLNVLLEKHAINNTIVNIDELFGRFALDIIFNVGFQLNYDFLNNPESYERLNSGVQGMFEYSWVPHAPFVGRFSHLKLPFYPYKQYATAASIIREYQVDILNHLRGKYRNGELAQDSFGYILMEFGGLHQLTEEEYLSEILVFIVAGHETTAHTLSWIIYALCKDSQLQQKCQMIMSQSLPIEESSSNVTSFALLPDFIEAVIKEALRKYPVASRGSFRVVSDENGVDLPIGLANCEGGEILYPETIHLKKGTWIGVNFFAAHHAKDNWGMDAFEFRPERWLKGGDDNNVHGDMNSPASYAGVGNSHDSISFLPFSYGVRNCVGMNLALWEIRTALKILMANYNFRFADSKFTDESYALQTDITLKPILGLPVYVSKIATAK